MKIIQTSNIQKEEEIKIGDLVRIEYKDAPIFPSFLKHYQKNYTAPNTEKKGVQYKIVTTDNTGYTPDMKLHLHPQVYQKTGTTTKKTGTTTKKTGTIVQSAKVSWYAATTFPFSTPTYTYTTKQLKHQNKHVTVNKTNNFATLRSVYGAKIEKQEEVDEVTRKIMLNPKNISNPWGAIREYCSLKENGKKYIIKSLGAYKSLGEGDDKIDGIVLDEMTTTSQVNYDGDVFVQGFYKILFCGNTEIMLVSKERYTFVKCNTKIKEEKSTKMDK